MLLRITKVTRPLAMRTAGKVDANTSVIRHVGRRSGRTYDTPIVAAAHDNDFLIALPYGDRTDWMKNVLANGKATIVTHGQTYEVNQPRRVPMSDATAFFGPKEQKLHRRYGVDSCLRVSRLPS
jgi:deazaflavin-dependent oxidoreductase (nitroreductase family)